MDAIEPAGTIDDVVDRLDKILGWATTHQSRLGYFPALYRKMTLAVRDGIRQDVFDDSPRMERIGVVFANRYLRAFAQHQKGERPSRAWLLAFEAARDWWPLVVQHLLEGMNAHINLDLGIAVAETVPAADLSGAKNDFDKINDLLADLVDTVQDELAEVWLSYRGLDWITGRSDEALVNFSLEKARDCAWKAAQDHSALDGTVRLQHIDALDKAAELIGRLVLHPGILTSSALRVIRLGEQGTVARIIGILR